MDDKEKIQSFGDMIEATHKLVAPWKRLCLALVGAIIAVAIVLSSVIFYLIYCAYSDPIEFEQVQDFTDQKQNQTYGEGVTHGE